MAFGIGVEAFDDLPIPLPSDTALWQKETPYLFHGRSLIIEYLPGDERTKVAADGTPYTNLMVSAYGYIQGTTDREGDRLDMFLAPVFRPDAPIFIMDQINPKTKTFDEHKVFFGYGTQEEVVGLYNTVFNDGSGMQRVGAITEVTPEAFTAWINNAAMLLAPASRQEVPGFLPKAYNTFNMPPLAVPPSIKPKTVVENGATTVVMPPLTDEPSIFSRSNGGKGLKHDVFLYGEVRLTTWYPVMTKLIRLMADATEADAFRLHISSPGGDVMTAGPIVAAMRSCRGTVTTIAEGPVASAGTLIWGEGAERIICQGAYFMEHMTSQVVGGNTESLSARLQFTSKYAQDQLSRLVHIGLFTQEEVTDMLYREADIFLTADEAIARVGAIAHD